MIDEFCLHKPFLKELGKEKMRPHNKAFWGPNFFIEEVRGEFSSYQHIAKKGLIRNYFTHDVSEVTRYAVPSIKAIWRLIPKFEEDNKKFFGEEKEEKEKEKEKEKETE